MEVEEVAVEMDKSKCLAFVCAWLSHRPLRVDARGGHGYLDLGQDDSRGGGTRYLD